MIKTKLSKFLLIALMFNLSVPSTIFAQEDSSDQLLLMLTFLSKASDLLAILFATHLVLIHLKVKGIEMQLSLGVLDLPLIFILMVLETMFSITVLYTT